MKSATDVERFDGREDDYLAWVQAHPDGFVANVDRAQVAAQQPDGAELSTGRRE